MRLFPSALGIALAFVALGVGSGSGGGPALVASASRLPIELITSRGERAYATPNGRAKALPVGTATTVRILYRGSAHSRRLVSLSHRGSSQLLAHASLPDGQAGWRLPAVTAGYYTLAVSVASLRGLFPLLVGRVRPGLGTG